MEKVIFDMDSVGDDILAIYFGLLNPNLEVLGITAENGACGSMEQAVKVALNSVALTGKKVPVYAGIDRPFRKKTKEEHEAPVFFGQRMTKNLDPQKLKIWNAPAPEPTSKPEKQNAVDFIIETIKSHPNQINLVATGPLTNIAFAIMQAPEIISLVKHCYIMGGTFQVPGNMTPVVEYNIWADPEASKIVLESGMPITLVPLDVCETNLAADSMLLPEHLEILAQRKSPVAQDIATRFSIYIDIWKNFWGFKGFPMDDVIALALIVDPTLCRYTEDSFVTVELEGSLSRGQTVAFTAPVILPFDQKNKTTKVCTHIDGKRFMDMFLSVFA
ncbi:MAG: nucleoside hydrolase [Brevinema sp.]